MKRIALVLSLMIVTSVGLFAVENSNTFFPLVQSPVFTGRVQYLIVKEAPVILTEAATGTYTAACHTKRAALAVSVSQNPASFAPVFAVHLTANINVTGGGALTGSASAGTLDTPAIDSSLFAAIDSLWSTVAGCVTNP